MVCLHYVSDHISLDDLTPHIAVFGKTPDLRQFSGPSQEAILRSYLQEKVQRRA